MNRIYYLVLLTVFSMTARAGTGRVAAEVQKMKNLNVAFYQHDLFANVKTVDESLKNELTQGTQAEIIPGKLTSLVNNNASAISVSIPFEGSTMIIELVRSNIFTDDFNVLAGENKIQPYAPGAYYRGIIRGDASSVCAFSFFDNQLYGSVSDLTHGNIVIGQLRDRPGSYVIYAAKDLSRPMENFCHTTEFTPGIGAAPKNLNDVRMSSTSKCVRVFYEIDFDHFTDNSSNIITTTNWITAIHNNIQTLYDNDNIDIALSQIYIWTTADPYTGSNSQDQITTFKATRITFSGDIAQLVANDGGFGGLGYLDALCTNVNYSYADVDFSFLSIPTYSWTVECMTHEIGHNLGSPHTHNCGWPVGALDNCFATEGGCAAGPNPPTGGTIMSYCHLSGTGINFANGFGPYPRDTIIYAVNNSGCLGANCAACPAPAHDACPSAATLAVNSNCVYVAGNLCGSTQSMTPISCGGFTATNGYDVWYRFTPTQTGININCVSGTATDAVVVLYSGTCGAFTQLSCSDATGTGGSESIAATLTAGTTYYIRVYDHNSNTTGTDFAICVSQNCIGNTNNGCGTATALTIGSTCTFVNGDLCAATQSMSPAQCSGFTANDALDLWYSITPTQNTVQVTASSGIDTDCILGIYSGTCGALNLIRCIDTTGSGGTEQFTVNLTVGNTYYIRIYDWQGNQFGTDFRICARYLCTTPAAATNITASVNPICTGDSTTLNANGTLSQFATWTWYAGSCSGTSIGTGTTINISPSNSMTYYVRAENGTCLSTCRNLTVVVTPIPLAPTAANANPASVCPGSSTSLNASGTLSGGASWHWYSDSCGGASIGNGATFNITPMAATTYYVRAQNGACYSACANVAITMDSIPADPVTVTASADTICAGDSITLNVTGTLTGNAAWHWYSGSCGTTAVDTGSSITISPTSTSTWYVRAEDGNCFSNCLSDSVVVNPSAGNPTSAGPSTGTCEGDSVLLTVTGSLGTGGDWYWYLDSCGGAIVGQGASLLVVPAITGTYYVRAENPTCISNCESALITVHPAPTLPVINVSGNILSVPASFAYQWYYSLNDSVFNPIANSQQITATANGYYFAEINDSNGCIAFSDTILYIDPNAIGEMNAGLISAFPNPVNDLLYISTGNRAAGELTIRLIDATGKLVFSAIRKNGTSTLDMARFADGVYELVIVDDNSVYTLKIVKE